MAGIEKSVARFLAIELAPECGEVLSDFRAKRDGWVKMPDEIEQGLKNLGLGAYYVIAYEDELRIHGCLYKAIFPKHTVKDLKELEAEFIAASEEEKLAFFKDETSFSLDGEVRFEWKDFFPKTEEAKDAAKKAICDTFRG